MRHFLASLMLLAACGDEGGSGMAGTPESFKADYCGNIEFTMCDRKFLCNENDWSEGSWDTCRARVHAEICPDSLVMESAWAEEKKTACLQDAYTLACENFDLLGHIVPSSCRL